MQIDTASLGMIVTAGIALVTLAAWVGALSNQVKNNRLANKKTQESLEKKTDDIRREFREYQLDNKADHILINNKLDEILRNWQGKV